jgi:hypothetical protein
MKNFINKIVTILFSKIFQMKFHVKTGDLSYNWNTETVYVNSNFLVLGNGIIFDCFISKWFSLNPDKSNYKILQLLHEIGHYFTFSEELYDTEIVERSFLTLSSDYYTQEQYYSLPTEYLATEWGVKFYTNHTKICKLFNFLLRQ